MGKSALLAAWLDRRERACATVPHHFIRRGEYDWDDPVKLVDSLVAQLEQRFPEQRELEADARMHPAARLEAALRRVSSSALVPRSERLVVLIDGLDEYDLPAELRGRDPLAAFLPRTLPPGVRLLCASRPRHPYVDMLATRGAMHLDLDDEQVFGDDNAATVRAFWEQATAELGLDAQFTTEAVARAAGNLQHAAMLRQHLAGLPAELRRVEAIPRGLAALLASAWERVATDSVVVDGLGILCAAREALTLDELGAVAGWTGEPQRRTFVRSARELLIESRRADGVSEYRLHHDSIRDQIVQSIGAAAATTAKVHLVDGLLYRHWDSWKDGKRSYTLIIDLTKQKDALRDLTPGPWNSPVFSVSGSGDYAFSPDGKELAFTSNHDPDPEISTNADLFTVPVDGSPVAWKTPRSLTSKNEGWDGQPSYTADGKTIVYRRQVTRRYESDRFRLAAIDRATGSVRDLLESFDNWVTSSALTADGKRVVFTADVKGRTPLMKLDLASGAPYVAWTLDNLGLLNRAEHRNAEARKNFEEALAIYRDFAARARALPAARRTSRAGSSRPGPGVPVTTEAPPTTRRPRRRT